MAGNEDINVNELVFSQDTYNIIANGLDGIDNTPPEPAVSRIMKENINNQHITLDVQATHYIKNINQKYKILDHNNKKMICLPKDARFTVKLNYDKHCTNDIFVRIYPMATDSAYKHNPISCCRQHGSKAITKVRSENIERAISSLIEIDDVDANYETIEISKDNVQTTIVVQFFAPYANLDMVIKCYNTCHEAFKRQYPQLNFSIERFVESKKHYEVLSEESIYFKVCASPARDSKSMKSRKRLASDPIPRLLPIKTEENSKSGYYVGENGEKYLPKMVPESMIPMFKFVEQCCSETDRINLANLENFIIRSMTNPPTS